jgi:thymidylate synthase
MTLPPVDCLKQSHHDTTYGFMIADINDWGVTKEQRAVLKDGTRPKVRSVFGKQYEFPLALGFPLLTTKKLPWKTIVAELLWFLNGDTNNKTLNEQGVHIWDEWATKSGFLGPVYGEMWRDYPCADGDNSTDQIAKLIQDIEKVKKDPNASAGRRLIVTAWHPSYQPDKAPPACHTFFQCNVTNGVLNLKLYQRSADVFLGVPFNIASYALLLHILAKRTGLAPGLFIHTFGDLHLYENHQLQADEQIERTPFEAPELEIVGDLTHDLMNLKTEQFVIKNYNCHPPLRGEVAV